MLNQFLDHVNGYIKYTEQIKYYAKIVIGTPSFESSYILILNPPLAQILKPSYARLVT